MLSLGCGPGRFWVYGIPAVWKALLSSGASIFRWGRTMTFLRQLQQLVSTSSDLLADSRAAKLITSREASLKPGRARLVQRDRLRTWEGDSGYFRVDYNWSPARRMLEDIHAGLGTPRVVAPGVD